MLEGIVFFILGTFWGSFLNVCIYRLPQELSIVKGRSFCPHCKAKIAWYDNIPILSFFILRGKCRSCSKAISLRYPAVEFLSGLFCLLLYTKFGFGLDFLKYYFFFSLLIVVSFIDIAYHAIPAYLCFVGIVVGLIFSFIETINFIKLNAFGFNLPLFFSFKALIFGFGFAYLFKFFGDIGVGVYLALRKKESIEGEKEALGLGDVDFMGMVGVFLGTVCVVLVFFLAAFIALLWAVFSIFSKRSHLIPYLPYLSLAAVVVFFWKDFILKTIGFAF